jgi:hypothetical protein
MLVSAAVRLHQRHKAAPRFVSSAGVALHCRITSQFMDMTSSFALASGKPPLSETARWTSAITTMRATATNTLPGMGNRILLYLFHFGYPCPPSSRQRSSVWAFWRLSVCRPG